MKGARFLSEKDKLQKEIDAANKNNTKIVELEAAKKKKKLYWSIFLLIFGTIAGIFLYKLKGNFWW